MQAKKPENPFFTRQDVRLINDVYEGMLIASEATTWLSGPYGSDINNRVTQAALESNRNLPPVLVEEQPILAQFAIIAATAGERDLANQIHARLFDGPYDTRKRPVLKDLAKLASKD